MGRLWCRFRLAATRANDIETEELTRSIARLARLARKVAPEWQAYLKALTALLHYAEHREADLADVFDLLRQSVRRRLIADVPRRASELVRGLGR